MIGLDLSQVMLNHARDRRIVGSYVEASSLELPFKEGAFNIAVSVNAFDRVSAFEVDTNEICRVRRRVILGLPHQNSLLLLAYVYRMLRGWGYRYTRHMTTRYIGAPLIYNLYFSTKESEEIFRKNHFQVIRSPKCRVIPFPHGAGRLIRVAEAVKKVSAGCLGRFGTFTATVAERKSVGD